MTDTQKHLIELPYTPDGAALFARVADLPWAVFLDSNAQALEDHAHARYDIITADPHRTLITRGDTTDIRGVDGIRRDHGDPFELLREALGEPVEPIEGIPFAGGALGYLAYDLGRRIEDLPRWARDVDRLPEMAVGLYDWALVVDHRERRCTLASHGRHNDTAERLRWLAQRFREGDDLGDTEPFRVTGDIDSETGRQDYADAFTAIQDYIREGDCYQVNYARRFQAPAEGSGWRAYQGLRAINPAPYGAYLNLPFAQVLSASPEQFLELREQRVTTRPIKGTRPRADDATEDRDLAGELAASAKDRAENLMIVDLLRNDLGRSCRPGSIAVPGLYALESYASVHHLVSTVTGELAQGQDAASLLRGCFPGGSITGAPKVRAMEIIEELEPSRRGIYCGSIAYLGYDGAMDSNIAIRTLTYANGAMVYWAGGGIVADSDEAAEYQETDDKGALFKRLLEAARYEGTVD
ncbi:MAG: aminodeoxychorismate synthase component I [Gammaproteobacteria bacterium]